MRRSILALFLAGSATASAPPVSSPPRGGDEAEKIARLEGLLGKLVYDKEKNPAGLVKAWYCVPAAGHKGAGCHCGACARQALLEEYRNDRREKQFEQELPAILKRLESPAERIVLFYGEKIVIGQKKRQGILLVGDLLGLGEEEVRSALEDYLPACLKSWEEGMTFKEEENEMDLDAYAPATREIARTSLVNLHARSVQLGKIAGKSRKVSEGYRQAVVRSYLDSLRLFSAQHAREEVIYEKNEENTLQKEIVFCLRLAKKVIQGNLKKAGLEHRVVNKETHEYALDGF